MNAMQYSLFKIKTPLELTRGVTRKRVTNGEVHLRGLAPGQHSPVETSQRRRAAVVACCRNAVDQFFVRMINIHYFMQCIMQSNSYIFFIERAAPMSSHQ